MNVLKACKYGLMIYDTKDLTIGLELNEYGEYSEAEVQLFSDCVNPGDVILDVGANIGAHTLVFSKLTGITGQVLAFEPEKHNYYSLCGNIALNNLENVVAVQVAVGNKEDLVDIPIVNHNEYYKSGGLSILDNFSQHPTYKIKLITIDSLALLKCNFMKIDVEGLAPEVIFGADKLIIDNKPIVYAEYHTQEEYIKIVDKLLELGYEVYEHITPYFNSNNYANNLRNVCVDEKNRMLVSCMIFAKHKDSTVSIDYTKYNMKKVTDPKKMNSSVYLPAEYKK